MLNSIAIGTWRWNAPCGGDNWETIASEIAESSLGGGGGREMAEWCTRGQLHCTIY